MNIGNSKYLARSPLLSLANMWNLPAGNCWIETTSVAISTNAVADLDAFACPSGDCASRAKIQVIGVGSYYKHSFDVFVADHLFDHRASRMPLNLDPHTQIC